MTQNIRISGMSCGGCVASVTSALERIGVTNHQVEIGRATVEYDEAEINQAEIVEAIEDAGFDVVETTEKQGETKS